MKHHIVTTMAFAAALVAAAPASAQRASLADRVAALEQQAANNQGNVDLLNQVTQLRSDLQALRSQIEELQQQNEQLKSTGRSQYLDLDGRLNRLEGGAGAAPGQPAIDPNSVPAAPQPSAAPPAAAAPADSAPAIHGDAGAIANRADERGAYETAFNALKGGQYADSAQLFQSFLQSYPSGAYAPNALYWLGESYYVTQNYALAQQQFQALLDRYPTHDKAPGALLKVGLAQYGQKQYDAAQKTLTDVSARYPGTDAARTAEDRLRAIQLSQVR
ncbi:tol-pal system protein YbgF [Luteimonas aquatica]|uniref:tol-pal system protein YbgF n=1 Tax=Luteimonas aquatica TaxID=450364 RepID=UPI001F5AF1CB|nr:tol-pal system protein YbgF [Luteimonas aquatica]